MVTMSQSAGISLKAQCYDVYLHYLHISSFPLSFSRQGELSWRAGIWGGRGAWWAPGGHTGHNRLAYAVPAHELLTRIVPLINTTEAKDLVSKYRHIPYWLTT